MGKEINKMKFVKVKSKVCERIKNKEVNEKKEIKRYVFDLKVVFEPEKNYDKFKETKNVIDLFDVEIKKMEVVYEEEKFWFSWLGNKVMVCKKELTNEDLKKNGVVEEKNFWGNRKKLFQIVDNEELWSFYNMYKFLGNNVWKIKSKIDWVKYGDWEMLGERDRMEDVMFWGKVYFVIDENDRDKNDRDVSEKFEMRVKNCIEIGAKR